MVKVAINGFGRIGRLAARMIMGHDDLQLVAVNDLADAKTSGHLFRYDSSYGVFQGSIDTAADKLVINGHEIAYCSEKDPAVLPWGKLGVDVVLDCTGRFTDKEKAIAHITGGGAKKVIISAPAKNEDITIVMGVNQDKYDAAKHHVVSNASCTTNCLAPVAKVLNERFGIVKGMMTTVHSYTNDQNILDQAHKDLRRARAGAISIIPTTTGAAKAVALVLPELKGKLNGFALRVPTPTVSVVDLVIESAKETTAEEVNQALRDAANGALKGILSVSEEQLVSVDFKGSNYSSIVDAELTMVMGGNQVKVVAWYDNEWGYTRRLVDLARFMGEKGI
ncbi:MAG: type I glyceraldehyde-3-phosphate dehydrogenase [Bacillota bacterium]